MSRTYQVSRTMCCGEAPASLSTAAMFSSASFICATKPLREAALRVLSDHAADEHHFAARKNAVGESLRPRPAGGLQHGVKGIAIFPGRAVGHVVSFVLELALHEASCCEAGSPAMRRSSKRCSLPVWVRGNAATYSMARGYLYGAMLALT